MEQKKKPEETFFFETSGFSMLPFLKGREKLIIKKSSKEDLRLGDLILYKIDNQLICHRLVTRIKGPDTYLFYARGDASLSPPQLVTEDMLLGKVSGIIKNGKITNITDGIKNRLINQFIVFTAPSLVSLKMLAKRLLRK